jgi:hypothetical protein
VRTVGQVVAEAIKLYGANLGPALALGLPVAVADQVVIDASVGVRVAVLVAASPFLSAAYAGACAILGQERPAPRVWLTAIAVGSVTFLPAAPFFPWFALVSILWLGLVGHAVPAVVVERAGPVAAIRRSVALARADYVHAAGSFATLAIVFWLTRIALGLLLSSQAEAAVRVAIFLADVVVSPLLFLGAAIVYVDLAARIGLSTEERRRIRDAAWGRAAK